MIDEVSKKHPELGKRLATVLEGNKKRLDGLSPAAVEYAKKVRSLAENAATMRIKRFYNSEILKFEKNLILEIIFSTSNKY